MRIGRGWSGPAASTGGATDPSWTRYLLNSGSTKTEPSGGATVTVNSESASGWSDISQAAQNQKQPVNLTNWSLPLTKADGSTPITFADLFSVSAQIVVNQFTNTAGSRTGANQTPAVYLSNVAVPSTSSHFYFGSGLGFTTNGTTIKICRIYGDNGSNNPAFTQQQVKSTGWQNAYRTNLTMSNTVGRGPLISLAEYRNFDNSQFQTGWLDIEGINQQSGLSTVTFGATDQVYLNLYFPGTNSGGSGDYDLVNMQFKLYYQVNVLTQDATA